MTFQIAISNPSGEKRTHTLNRDCSEWTFGRDPNNTVILRDLRVAPFAGRLKRVDNRFWLESADEKTYFQLHDWLFQKAEWWPGAPVVLGDTTLELRSMLRPVPARSDGPVFGSDPSITSVRQLLTRLAPTKSPIVLVGETGLRLLDIARWMHQSSERKEGFLKVVSFRNLTSEDLLGSTDLQKPSLIMKAHQGTLILEGLENTRPESESILREYLTSGKVKHPSFDREFSCDTRLVFTSSRSLENLFQSRVIESETYYRLKPFEIAVPSLRTRPSDLTELLGRLSGERRLTLAPPALESLCRYGWPGNIDEVESVIERCRVEMNTNDAWVTEGLVRAVLPNDDVASTAEHTTLMKFGEMERWLLLKALRLSGGHRARAAKLMGISRSTVFEMIKRHQIQGPRQRLQSLAS